MSTVATGTRAAAVRHVIETQSTRGAGVQGDPIRIVRQYWSVDGEFLCECDPETGNGTDEGQGKLLRIPGLQGEISLAREGRRIFKQRAMETHLALVRLIDEIDEVAGTFTRARRAAITRLGTKINQVLTTLRGQE